MKVIADTHAYLDSVISILKIQIAAIFPKVLVGISIVILFFLLAYLSSWIIRRIVSKLTKNNSAVSSLAKSAQMIILLVGIITALGTIGVNVSALIASLGLLGFACGFAFKDFLSNAIAGIMLLIYQPFKNQDYIALDNIKGKVIEINLRYTVLNGDNEVILVPNQVLLSRTVRIVSEK